MPRARCARGPWTFPAGQDSDAVARSPDPRDGRRRREGRRVPSGLSGLHAKKRLLADVDNADDVGGVKT
jgi:hypothetical protein